MALPPAQAALLGDLPPEVEASFRRMLGQLPIVWASREGGTLRVKISEIDACGPFILDFKTEGEEFVFTLRRKD